MSVYLWRRRRNRRIAGLALLLMELQLNAGTRKRRAALHF
jgi:hypothetical protein